MCFIEIQTYDCERWGTRTRIVFTTTTKRFEKTMKYIDDDLTADTTIYGRYRQAMTNVLIAKSKNVL